MPKPDEVEGSQTAITRKKLSAPMQWLVNHNLVNKKHGLDYGCGKAFDASFLGLQYYDPYYYPCPVIGLWSFISCIYVLNVMPPQSRVIVLKEIEKLLVPEGKAYIAVRRDLPIEGKKGRGCYQYHVTLPYTLLVENNNFAIYEINSTNRQYKE